MAGSRSALIIATTDYQAEGLRRLRAPSHDAEALARILQDPQIGGFDVRTVLNRPTHELMEAIEEFFADRRPDDLLVAHISGHGIKDEAGELYFAALNTKVNRLGATAVSADFVNRLMNRSRSRRVVLLLDCCYAGAFERGMMARAGTQIDVGDRFEGRGRAVITASSAMEYAFEGADLADARELAPSVFTSALVEGLDTGEADRNQDGYVALDELYDYVYDRVRATTPNQTPSMWTFALQGDLYIARRARPVTTPAPLPDELQQAIDHPLANVRASAVQELERLLQSRHAGLALAAELALERLSDDDSRRVSATALAALAAAQRTPTDEPATADDQNMVAPASPEVAAPTEPLAGPRTGAGPIPHRDEVPTGAPESQGGVSQPATTGDAARGEPAPPGAASAGPVPPRLVLSSSRIDFGRLPLGGESPSRVVRIENAGGGELRAHGTTTASWLRLRQVDDELVITADTAQEGSHEGTITVESLGGSASVEVRARVTPLVRSEDPGRPPGAHPTLGGPRSAVPDEAHEGPTPPPGATPAIRPTSAAGSPPRQPQIGGGPPVESPAPGDAPRPAEEHAAQLHVESPARPDDDGKEPRRRRQLVIWSVAAGVVVLALVGIIGWLTMSPSPGVATGHGCPTGSSTAPTGASASPGEDPLASRAIDAAPLTVEELCQPSYTGGTGTFTQTGWDRSDDCTTALYRREAAQTPADGLLKTLGCSQVVSITAVNSNSNCTTTFGAFNFPDEEAADRMINALPGEESDGAVGLAFKRHDRAEEGDPTDGYFLVSTVGHWMAYAVSYHTDGQARDDALNVCNEDGLQFVTATLNRRG